MMEGHIPYSENRGLGGDGIWPPTVQRWPPVFPPVCASAWGDDRFGLWIDVLLEGTLQRFRWIEPGEFLMGSPESEEGHQKNEDPLHLVRLTEGYWLADTACSQAVWCAVMGNNPSIFKSDPQNPVDQLSWNDVQLFLKVVERLLPSVRAVLPTEAEWEYACRAGSKAAFSWGECIDSSLANYRASDGYAGAPAGEYRGRTLPVKSFEPNGWGLYQMHGNVSEWCADGMRQYAKGVQIDPRGAERDISRVVRGGSWLLRPHHLRAAHRILRPRDIQRDSPGFRFCLKVIE